MHIIYIYVSGSAKRAHLHTCVHLRFLASFEGAFAEYYDNVFGIAIAHSVHEIYRVLITPRIMLFMEARCKLSVIVRLRIPIIG